MAERLRYNAPSVFTERAPQINYDDGTVDYMNQLSGLSSMLPRKRIGPSSRARLRMLRNRGLLPDLLRA